MKTRLSIIIPVYRVSDTLDKCVDSIVRQKCDGMEIILVDDGSPDDCPEKCDQWAARDKRISVIHKPNGGLSDARNAGIELANGSYITFVDSDDFLGADTYGPLMDVMDRHPEYDILEYPVAFVSGNVRQQIMTFSENAFQNQLDYWMETQAYKHSYAWNKIYRKEMFQEIRFPVDRVFEDIATLPLLLKHTKCVATTNKGLYHYCDNANGITARARGNEWRMLLESYMNAIDWCRTHPLFHQYYMHVVNVQIREYELTGDRPRLQRIPIKKFDGINNISKLKAIIINILGINALCRINRALVKIAKLR